MIVFESQEAFEQAVKTILADCLSLKATTYRADYYSQDRTAEVNLLVDSECVSNVSLDLDS